MQLTLKNNCIIFPILLSLPIFSQVSYAELSKNILVYTGTWHQGQIEKVSIANCSDLPTTVAGKVLSIHTQGQCAALYDAKKCSGNSVEIMRHSPSHYSLDSWNFQEKTMSVGPCRDSCHPNVTGPAPQKGEKYDLTIFSKQHFRGNYQNLKVEGCTLIPTKFIYKLLSVKVYDNCLEFYRNADCHIKNEERWDGSIELRRGTPQHDDISSWHFPVARSVSHCSFKCNSKTIEEARKLREKLQMELPTQINEIYLYDAVNFTGNRHSLILTHCVNLTDDWEGAAMSIKPYDQDFCVKLFDKHGCGGEPNSKNVAVIGSSINLEENSFGQITRSMEPCGNKQNRESTSVAKELNGQKKEGFSFYLFLIIATITIISVVWGIGTMIIRKRNENNLSQYTNNLHM